MQFLGNIKHFIRKPFPIEESNSQLIKIYLLIGVFVTLFLYIFKPFGFEAVEKEAFLICLGFGVVSFVVSLIYEFGIISVLQLKATQTHFTFSVWIFYVVGLILCISFANFFYTSTLFGEVRWAFLPDMMYGTFAIGIFPTLLMGAIAVMRQEKKFKNIALEINSKKSDLSIIGSPGEKVVFDIPLSQIRYIVALQNYVKIGYVDNDGLLRIQTERATLKRISDELKGSTIVKCHRSYLVNRDAIIATAGNAQGLLLTLSDCDKLIPVSRSFVSVFRSS